jgi:CheY-like chemotaxis protein
LEEEAMAVLLVIDDNVNARVICEVLLDSRGERCRLCGQHEPHACAAALDRAEVAIFETNLANEGSVHELRQALGELRRSAQPAAVVVVSDDEQRVRAAGLGSWADRVLPAPLVGRDLLPLLDALRGATSQSRPFAS